MHIALCAPIDITCLFTRFGGPPQFTRGLGGTIAIDLADRYQRAGHHVDVVTVTSGLDRSQLHTMSNLRIGIAPCRNQGWRRTMDAFSDERRAMTRLLRDLGPDVVHAHWTYEFALAAINSGIPTLVTAHDAPWTVVRHALAPRTVAYRIIRALMAHSVSRRAARMTAVSPYLAEYWRTTMRRTLPLTVIPNGLATIPGATVRHLPTDGRFCCVAINQGFGHRKNTSALIRAWPKIIACLPQARLIMIGVDHGPGEPAQLWAASRGLGDGIEFRGAMSNLTVRKILAEEAHVLVHPSLEECCPMVFLEAHAVGLPSVGGRSSGGVPYVMGDGATGRMVDVTDPNSIAAGVCDLLSDPVLYQRCSASALRTTAEYFSLDRVTQLYIDELTCLLSTARR